ncbi:MAG: hypothetical protein RL582_1217 [Bacteroidota bacterium]|jgi:phage shock protein E
MKKYLLIFSLLFTLFSCSEKQGENENNQLPFVESSESIIIDVRTVEEWQSDGHSPCSVSIPLNELEQSVDSLKKYKQIGIVCRSGNRAEQAKTYLSSQGHPQVYNLGAWQNINCKK